MEENQRRKIRLEQLLNKQKQKKKEICSALFNECICALDNETIVYSEQKTSNIIDIFQEQYPFLVYGRIDWEKVKHVEVTVKGLQEKFRDRENEECYIIWSHGYDPVIRTKVINVLNKFDDVSAVSPDVWFFKENEYVIEFFHDGVFRLGYYQGAM